MSQQGYYRYPAIHGERVVFVSEDDLWEVPASGGEARRLTTSAGEATRPAFSPDGTLLAFTGREEGTPEIHVMPAGGGEARRLTFLGATSAATLGWTPDGKRIYLASDWRRPFMRDVHIHSIGLNGESGGGEPEPLPWGRAQAIAHEPNGKGIVLGRNMGAGAREPAHWKRYRGGTAGVLWLDAAGKGEFRRLLPDLKGNLASPMWLGGRVWFLSDHEGVGNLYSCLPTGEDVRRHTDHEDFYARNASTDGKRIVYHAGGDLYLFDPAKGESRKMEISFAGPRAQRRRKFVEAGECLEDAALHPKGHSVALTARGGVFAMGNWEGACARLGAEPGARYRMARWMPDGKRVLAVTDAAGEEELVLFTPEEGKEERLNLGLSIGRALDMEVSPAGDMAALSNHRHEAILADLSSKKARLVERSAFRKIAGLAWSPDGRWLAYGFASSRQTFSIKIADAKTGETRLVTGERFRDMVPSFDPDGKYLYFLSYRSYDPVYDALYFDLGFPRGMRPCLLTLRKDELSPFAPPPRPLDENGAKPEKGEEKAAEVNIDFEGIEERVLAFPVPEGRYGQIAGVKGKALWTEYPVEGSLAQAWPPKSEPEAKAALKAFNFSLRKEETLVEGLTAFSLSADAKTMLLRIGNRLRAVKAGEPPSEGKETPGRESGWLDLSRASVEVEPAREWRQMLREAWRLQRDHFWTEDISGVDWRGVLARYESLVGRAGTRGELSDLIWEMQGELGTSHAYEMGGDYREAPSYPVGQLGCDLAFDAAKGLWKITRVVEGDSWDERAASPLRAPGVMAKEGDTILAVNGMPVGRDRFPSQCLVHLAGAEILLTLGDAQGKNPRVVPVKTLRDEKLLRYRAWVEGNRRLVGELSGGRAGYVHVPNMGPWGYAEFHRQYATEVDRDGIVVDVRFNGGGHVSPLILEKLARKRLGYDSNRWGAPEPYPEHSPRGPLVALTNENAGSDGDIFSHCFKLMKLGPLVGKRTWGGVVGIDLNHLLADGTFTSQPEYAFWFTDAEWGVENYGAVPDIEVDIAPQDYAAGRDPQILRAVSEMMKALEKNPPAAPDFSRRPKLTPPKLPKR